VLGPCFLDMLSLITSTPPEGPHLLLPSPTDRRPFERAFPPSFSRHGLPALPPVFSINFPGFLLRLTRKLFPPPLSCRCPEVFIVVFFFGFSPSTQTGQPPSPVGLTPSPPLSFPVLLCSLVPWSPTTWLGNQMRGWSTISDIFLFSPLRLLPLRIPLNTFSLFSESIWIVHTVVISFLPLTLESMMVSSFSLG